MRSHIVIDSPIGPLTLVANNGVLCELHMQAPTPGDRAQNYGQRSPLGFEQAIEELDEYFAGKRTQFDLELTMEGNLFQRKVWDQLKLIPFGKTKSYGEIAEAVGDKTLARSVGTACGSNPIAIIVPCHRVIGSDGTLVGFGGGLERKEFLLHLENPAAHPISLRLF